MLPWTSTTGGPEPVLRTWNPIARERTRAAVFGSGKRVWPVTSSTAALVCSRPDGARPPLVLPARSRGRFAACGHCRVHRLGRSRGRGGRLRGPRRPGGRRRRDPRRHLRRLPPLQRRFLVIDRVVSTPRAVPGRMLPLIAAGAVIALALPVFLIAG